MNRPRSKEDVKCAYCKTSVRRDNLKEHHSYMSQKEDDVLHKGKPVKELGMGDIKSLFSKQTVPDKSAEVSQILEDAIQEEGVQKGQKRKLSEEEGRQTDEQSNKETKRAKIDVIEEKLDQVLDRLSRLNIDSSPSTPSNAGSDDSADVAEEVQNLKLLVQNAKTLKRLCELASLTIIDDTTVLCEFCDGEVDRKLGVFKFDSSLRIDFTSSSQPQSFVKLKKSCCKASNYS